MPLQLQSAPPAPLPATPSSPSVPIQPDINAPSISPVIIPLVNDIADSSELDSLTHTIADTSILSDTATKQAAPLMQIVPPEKKPAPQVAPKPRPEQPVFKRVSLAHRTVNPWTIAGNLQGKPFYWVKDRVQPDTIGWDEVFVGVTGGDSSGQKDPEHSVGIAASKGKTLYKIIKPNAMAIAVLFKCRIRVLVLSQWAGSVLNPEGIDMRGRFEDNTIASDYLWEIIDSTVISPLGSVGGDYRIRTYFRDNGVSDYKGKQQLYLSRAQIMGTSGFNLQNKSKDQVVEENMHRMLLSFYIAVDSNVKQPEIIKEIDRQMDSMKLDLTFKPPVLVKVNRK